MQVLESLSDGFDLIVSMLPFNAGTERLSMTGEDGTSVDLRDDLGHLILVAAAARLSDHALGIFVVPPCLDLASASMPPSNVSPGSFLPCTNIPAYLIAIRKGSAARMFVAELSGDDIKVAA
jgi:hypothetical protein